MSFFSTLIVTLLVSVPSWSAVEYFRLGRGQVMAYEYVPAKDSQKTLILLPGVNRALSTQESGVKGLIQKGWGVLLPSLVAHPLSIQGLESSETPAFVLDSSLRVQNFADDIEQLVRYLQISDAVPVALSYTSAVAAYMDASVFPHVIQTVPMIEAAENNPAAAQQAELWESWFRLNPFLAPFWIRSFRDQAYNVYWGQMVDENLKADPNFYGRDPRVYEIKQGYVTIARASEDFDFKQWNFNQDNRVQDFVLAEKENPVRLANQIQTIQNYLRAGKGVRVVVVKNSDHILPSSQPDLYVEVVSLLASTPATRGAVQFAEIKSPQQFQNFQWQGQDALEDWISRQ